VIVTAQRRAENIKDVPMSIATLKGDKLDVLTSGAADIRFLAGRSPSVNVESDYGRTFPRFYIRGLGNTDFDLNASQPVGLVMDDIVQENAMLKGFPVFDVDQVEVLRGPQGTLFGRNSPAGVIKFDSAKPVFKTEGYLQLGVGNYSAKTVEGVFNVPVSDTVALRFSGTSQHRDDRVHNTNPNKNTAPRTSKATATTPSACKPWYSRTRTSARCSTTTSATTTARHAVPRQHHQEGHQRPGGRLRLRFLPDRRRQLPEAGNQGRQYPPEVQPERHHAALDHRLRNAEVQQPRRRRRRLRRRVRAAIGSGLHPVPGRDRRPAA
jgi:outer membrane receptor protein involved in Fe transport